MRVILYTGKGGVGKTSLSAATGVRAAELGYRTLVMSTDAAHSLGDSLGRPVGPDPIAIAENLDAVEIDVNHELAAHWAAIQDYLSRFLASQGYDAVVAEELGIPPGMDELFALMRIGDFQVEGRYELLVVDCAPTGGTLRMLGLTELLEWYMDKFFEVERRVVRAVRPVAEKLMSTPLPSDDVYAAIGHFYSRIRGVRELLMDPKRTTIRIVSVPERMVIQESQRAFTYLGLFGFPVDAVVANRVLPPEVKGTYFSRWRKIQEEQLAALDDAFRPIPIFPVQLFDSEVVGLDALHGLARAVFGSKDPTKVFYKGKSLEVRASGAGYDLALPLPHAKKDEVKAWTKGDELIVSVGNFRRNLVLPRSLAGLEVTKARLDNGIFRVHFE